MVKFSERIDIKQNTLSEIENNKYGPGFDFFDKIARNTDINLNWLQTGEGEMTRSVAMEKKQDQGQAMQMLLDIFSSTDSEAMEAIFANLKYFSGQIKKAQADRRKAVDPKWLGDNDRRGGGGLNASQG